MNIYKLAAHFTRKYAQALAQHPLANIADVEELDESNETDKNNQSHQGESSSDNYQGHKFKSVQATQTSAIPKYGDFIVTDVVVDPSLKGSKPSNWTPLGASVPVEAGAFARYALDTFLKQFGGQAFANHGSAVLYLRSKMKPGVIYAGRLETHQHANATEHGGAGKGNALMQPHSGVTVYQVT